MTFRSPLGKVTLEDINIDSIGECLEKAIAETAMADFENRLPEPISIKVAGMTWDKWDDRKRVRGIPNVAVIRFFHHQQLENDIQLFPNAIWQQVLREQGISDAKQKI